MLYDRSKTLMEQKPESVADRQLGITQRNAAALGMDVRDYEKKVFGPVDIDWDDIVEFWSDPHNALMAVEIGAMFIAPFTGPLAPVFLGFSIAAGLADSAVYLFRDDDPHSALIAAALVLVPEIKLYRIFKKSNWFIKKYGREATEELLQKYNKFKNGDESIKFTDEEIKFLKESGEDLASESAQQLIKAETKTTIKKGIIRIATEKVLKALFALVYNTAKFVGKTLVGTGIMLGGTYYTFDKLYLYIWGNDEYRQKSELKQIADLIVTFSSEIKTWLINIFKSLIEDLPYEDEEEFNIFQETILPKNEPMMSSSEYLEMEKREFEREQENLPGKKITLDNIRGGIESLHYGDQGPSVKQIQQMLIDLGLDLGVKGADGYFGYDTKDAVEEFQLYPEDYGFEGRLMLHKIDGIVGRETLKAMESALNNKKNG